MSGNEDNAGAANRAKNVTAAASAEPVKTPAKSASRRAGKSSEGSPETVPTKAARKPVAKASAGAGAKAQTASAASSKADAAPAKNAAAAKPAARAAAKSAASAKSATSARARVTARADTRTTGRRKPVAAEKAAPAAEAPKPVPAEAAAAPQPASQPAPSSHEANADRADLATGSTAAFLEAAFGVNSHLPEKLMANIDRIESLTQRLAVAMAQRKQKAPGVEGPGPDLFATATNAWLKQLAEQPGRIIEQQVSYWGETLRHFADAQSAMVRGTLTSPPDEGPSDRRFANPLWEHHPFFNFVKRQYQINASAMEKASRELDIESLTDRRRVDWFTRQIIDMMAPTNFLATNPDALEKALETEGESLVQGLENLVRDVEQHGGEMIVSLADRDAFRVGENIGTTKGTVVARTRLYELIQYAPTTESVHKTPLVIFPPWINKFYIMDLKPQNSLIKWIVDQGFTLFVVAWKNPDDSYGDTGMDDYVNAYLEVMDRMQDLTGEDQLNAVGYCIAGTTLSLTLSLLKQRGDDRVKSATFFTTLTDFSDQGEFTAYLQDDFVSGIEEEISHTGILSSKLMTRTFSFLRANDLVWGPAIRSYMLGEAPPAFDLLFWNGDGTNLPGRMASEYLRNLCQQNAFVGEGFTLFGKQLNIRDLDLPICAIACETDHIAPARDSWRGVSMMASRDKTFILSESGHIAGIINPPSKKKYGHYTSDAGFEKGYEAWRNAAVRHDGSWWGRWGQWLAGYSGPTVPARDPGEGMGPAPGIYVHERP